HDDVRPAVLGGAGVDDRDDVRVVGDRDGGLELLLDRVRGGHVVVDEQHLDRDGAVEALLDGAVDERGGPVRYHLEVAEAGDGRGEGTQGGEIGRASRRETK